MNPKSQPTSAADSPPVGDLNAICDGCGGFGAFAFGEVKLCLNCYSEKGSCCPEFGKDDLWGDRYQSDRTKSKA